MGRFFSNLAGLLFVMGSLIRIPWVGLDWIGRVLTALDAPARVRGWFDADIASWALAACGIIILVVANVRPFSRWIGNVSNQERLAYYPPYSLPHGPPGTGGAARAGGEQSRAIGGSAGKSGLVMGGAGGPADSPGAGSFAHGGAGGDAPTADGRGARGGRGPVEIISGPTALWGYGAGGGGSNCPEYDRRVNLLNEIFMEYVRAFPDSIRYLHAGIDRIPINWTNKRLEEKEEAWRVEMGVDGYILPPLPHHT